MLPKLLRTTSQATLGRRALTSTTTASSPWANVQEGPPDAILGLNALFAADEDPRKLSVGVGAYRGSDGQPFVLPSVKEAEKQLIAQNLNREYLPITGLASFNELACDMIYGKDRDSPMAKTQVLSGTGGLRVGTWRSLWWWRGAVLLVATNSFRCAHCCFFTFVVVVCGGVSGRG
jgi:aspartate aminotransferase